MEYLTEQDAILLVNYGEGNPTPNREELMDVEAFTCENDFFIGVLSWIQASKDTSTSHAASTNFADRTDSYHMNVVMRDAAQ